MNAVHTSPDAVRARIAAEFLTSSIPEALGDIVLRPHQRDAVARLHDTLGELHIALLADDVGLGKTFVALAVAQRYQRVRIIAPAALLPMWRQAVVRAQSRGVVVESLQRYSRSVPERPPHASSTRNAGNVRRTPSADGREHEGTHETKHEYEDETHTALVIIDEAHHLRTPTTRRYRAISDTVAGHDLLLLSATPLHNSEHDMQSLLALALGAQAKRLTPALLARVVVRRTQQDMRPSVREHPAHIVPHDRAILDAILTLPAPLPAHDGAVAGALIRLGLLRAWCSSDAALTHSLRRRLLRGEALRQALESGRHPTTAELRSWLVGEHEVQLAFPELLANHAPEVGPLVEILSRHLDAVQSLLVQHRASARADTMRADTLRQMLADHHGTPVVAFSQFAETVRALGRALSDIAGVGVLTSRRAWIASGPISREEALAHFAPVAHGRPPPPPHLQLRLLLATDLLAEGVNLQDAGVVVHLDLPWTDALRQQRVGRCVRLGSPHAEVSVYRFELPDGADMAMRLYRRLRRKATLAERLVGRAVRRNLYGTVHGTVTRARDRDSAPDSATRLRALLTGWLNTEEVAPLAGVALRATVHASRGGFLALVRDGHARPQLLCGTLRGARGSARDTAHRARLVLSTSPSRVLGLLEQPLIEQSHNEQQPTDGRESLTITWEWIERAITRWRQRVARDRDLGRGAVDRRPESLVHQRARAELRRLLLSFPASQRGMWGDEFAEVDGMLGRVRGASVERDLAAWLDERPRRPVEEWIGGWRSYAAIARADGQGPRGATRGATRGTSPSACRIATQTPIIAVLLLQPR